MYSIWLGETLLYSTTINNPDYGLSNPVLTLEAGSAGSLSFTIYPTHPEYENLKRMIGFIRVYENDDEIFRGRILKLDTNMYRERKVTCEGDLAYLLDSQSMGGEYTETIADHFKRLVEEHNAQVEEAKKFKVGEVTVTDATVSKTFKTDSGYRTVSNAMSNDLTSTYGGYIRTRRDGDDVYLDYIGDYGKAGTQNIEFGVNLIDYSESVASDDIFTVLLPTDKNGGTLESITGSKYIEIPNGITSYGRIVRAVSFSEVSSPGTDLVQAAYDYIVKNYELCPPTLTLTALDLRHLGFNLDALELGKRIGVYSEPHGINGSPVCNKISYNLEYPEKNIYNFSEINSTSGSNSSYTVSTGSTTSSSSSGSSGSSGGCTLTKYINATDEALKVYNTKIITLEVENSKLQVDATQMKHEILDEDGTVSTLKNTIEGFSSTYVTKDGVVNSINNNDQGVLISASKINLDGYVTANELDAKMADVTWLKGKHIETFSITAQAIGRFATVVTGDLTVGGESVLTASDKTEIQEWVTNNFQAK